MTSRERAMAVLNYEDYDALPVVHFGYWGETVAKWVGEGHITPETAADESKTSSMLGFDFGWSGNYFCGAHMHPLFEGKVLEELEDGSRHELNQFGVVVKTKPGINSIPSEVSHLLHDRESWEKDFKHRFQYFSGRTPDGAFLRENNDDIPRGLHIGSLFGTLRDVIGVVGISYLYADDEELYAEIINDNANMTYECVKAMLEQGARFDYAHFWEDICYKNGPLVSPGVFEQYVGPHYKRITDLCARHGIHIISLDCDGMIDSLVPIWLENGVNTMFPIEVGTWEASIKPWREAYGRNLRGVGGMNKLVFAYDYAAVDREIERLKPLIELGGYIPCPDHRIPPDAIWENVQYYCDRMHTLFG